MVGPADYLGTPDASARGGCDGGESRWCHAEAGRSPQRVAGGVEDAADAAVQAQQAGGVKADEAWPFGLDGGAHRFETDEQPLPSVSYADRIGWNEHQPWTTRECLPEAHADMDAERLGSE